MIKKYSVSFLHSFFLNVARFFTFISCPLVAWIVCFLTRNLVKGLTMTTPRIMHLPPKQAGDQRKFIIVAGGAGFVGSNLTRRLLDLGHSVLCVDNLLTGDMENVAELTGRPGFRFRRHDIIKPLRVDGPVDEIYNLACPASPPRYQKDPIILYP